LVNADIFCLLKYIIPLFYLTVGGKDASDHAIEENFKKELKELKDKDVLHDISYKKDIKIWLEECMEDVGSYKVKYLLEAYIEVIIRL